MIGKIGPKKRRQHRSHYLNHTVSTSRIFPLCAKREAKPNQTQRQASFKLSTNLIGTKTKCEPGCLWFLLEWMVSLQFG
jgi:hypothetical protein